MVWDSVALDRTIGYRKIPPDRLGDILNELIRAKHSTRRLALVDVAFSYIFNNDEPIVIVSRIVKLGQLVNALQDLLHDEVELGLCESRQHRRICQRNSFFRRGGVHKALFSPQTLNNAIFSSVFLVHFAKANRDGGATSV